MILTLKSLIALHSIFQLKLNLGNRRIEAHIRFVNLVGGKTMMSPPYHHLIPLMLQLILPSSIKLAKFLLDIIWITLVLCHFNKCLLQVISHIRHWFWLWRLTNLPNELISVLVLSSWLHQKRTIRLQVKHSVIFFSYIW